MGLDMYLCRMPRYRDATAEVVDVIESYLDWQRRNEEDPEFDHSLEDWCRLSVDDLPTQEYIDFYKNFHKIHYSDFDTDKKYGFYSISSEVGYWRKANQIHRWFVEHVQDGVDDCRYHAEVTEDILKELLNDCNEVLSSCELVKTNDEDYIKNAEAANRILPSSNGFFFGDTSYNEYYIYNIEKTMGIIENILKTTDFESQMIYYRSSW